MDRIYKAAKDVLAKIERDHPGEELYEPVMIELKAAVEEYDLQKGTKDE